MGRPSKYPDELRERAVRMVAEVRPQYPSQWAAITAVAGMLGIGAAETLRTWIRRAEVDTGVRPGVTSQMAEENKALRKEIAELRRAVEPMCAVLSEHGVPISASTYYEWITKTPTRRQLRDTELIAIIAA